MGLRYSIAIALSLTLGWLFPNGAAARADHTAPPAGESPESDRLYQTGMDYYAEGDLAAALASFREALRREPGNRSALAAVRRLEGEASPRSAVRRSAVARAPRPAPAGALDHFFPVSLPRWFYSERTLGDGLRDVGTLNALNARVIQLLGEKKVALAQNRPFMKDGQLRELLRRAPGATQGLEEA